MVLTSYCVTSSENAVTGGTGGPGQWPFSKTIGEQFDESALSVSVDSGFSWNQIGLIDTVITRLSDVATLETTSDTGGVLYLATDNATINGFKSVWRSTSDPLGYSWQRILLQRNTTTNSSILRINPRDNGVSEVLVYADLNITH